MAKFGDSGEILKCSFCGKSQKQVKKLIAGPGVYICDECVDLCNEIIEEEFAEKGDVRFEVLPTPQETREFLDQYVVGQDQAKKFWQLRSFIIIAACNISNKTVEYAATKLNSQKAISCC